MKVSREQMAQNRNRILDEASRLFRAKGFESVGIAEVMSAAGLTHGGFYGHFKSKDDLIAKTLAHDFSTPPSELLDLPAYLDSYLSTAHCRDVAAGCPISALAAEVRRQPPEARAAMTEGIRSQITRLAEARIGDSPAGRQRAIASWAAMIGAMVLARASDDPALSDEIVAETRAWLMTAEPTAEPRDPAPASDTNGDAG